MVADVVRVFDIRNEILAPCAIHILDAGINWKLHKNQISVNFVVESFPRCLGRPVCIRWTPPAKSLARKKGKSARPAETTSMFFGP